MTYGEELVARLRGSATVKCEPHERPDLEADDETDGDFIPDPFDEENGQ